MPFLALALANFQVVSSMDDKIYVSLRPLLTHSVVSVMRESKARPLSVVRASSVTEVSVKSFSMSIEECEAAAVIGNFPNPPPVYRP